MCAGGGGAGVRGWLVVAEARCLLLWPAGSVRMGVLTVCRLAVRRPLRILGMGMTPL